MPILQSHSESSKTAKKRENSFWKNIRKIFIGRYGRPVHRDWYRMHDDDVLSA